MEIKKFTLFGLLLVASTLFANNLPMAVPTNLPSTLVNPPSCDIPAPTNFVVQQISTDWVKLQWVTQGLPSTFKLRTYEAGTNVLVSTVTVPGNMNFARVAGLLPGHTYYSRITPVCQSGSESIYFKDSENYKMLIIDLIVTGFEGNSNPAICTINSTTINNYCDFDINIPTTFKLYKKTNPSDAVEFGMLFTSFDGSYQSLLPNGGGNYSFRCSATTYPQCNTNEVQIWYGNQTEAIWKFKVIGASANGLPIISCSGINSEFELIRRAPSFATNDPSDDRNGLGAMAFHVSPNPFSDRLEVKFNISEFKTPTSIALYDLQGKLIIRQDIAENTETQILSTENLVAGMYFLRVESSGEAQTIKVIKTQ